MARLLKSEGNYESSSLKRLPAAITVSLLVMVGDIVLFAKRYGGVLTGPNYGTGDCFAKIVVLSIASSLTSVILILDTPLMLLQTLLFLL